MPRIEGTFEGAILIAGAPSAGTSQVDTLTIDATGGTFKLAFEGLVTASISWSATNATLVANVQAALDAIASLGSGQTTVAVGTMTAGVGTLTITYGGNLAKKAITNKISVYTNALTGTATLSTAVTTPGVDADGRGAGKGTTLNDTTNGIAYINTGTALAPT